MINLRKITKLFIFNFFLISSVNASMSIQDYYEDAVIRLNNDDSSGAIIQLKNLLKEQPSMLPAIILLGKAYLADGDPENAETKLIQADILGADPELTHELLAKSFLQQSKYQELINFFKDKNIPPHLESEIFVSRGHAYLALAQHNDALLAFDQALFLNPKNTSAMAGHALFELHNGRLNKAKELINQASIIKNNNPQVWNVKASISHLEGNLLKAITEYTRAIELDSNNLNAHIARVGLYLDLKQNQQAKQELAALIEEFKHEPNILYLSSVLSKKNNQIEQAKKHLDLAVGVIDSMGDEILMQSKSKTFLAGLIYYDSGRYKQAKIYLEHLIKTNPKQIGAIKLYASTLLQLSEFTEAFKALSPVINNLSNDPSALSVIAEAASKIGNFESASTFLEQLNKITPNNVKAQVDLAINYAALGKKEMAVDRLEAIEKKYPANIATLYTITQLYYKQNNIDLALIKGEKLLKLQPDNINVLNLLGNIYAAASKYSLSRKSFKHILSIKSDHSVAKLNLAKLFLAENKPNKSRQALLAMNKSEPNNLHIYQELSRLEEQIGDVDKAIRWLDKALGINKDAHSLRLRLAKLYLKKQLPKQAVETAMKILFQESENFYTVLKVTEIIVAAKDLERAKGLFHQLTKIALVDAKKLFQVAKLQLKLNLTNDAITTLKSCVHYQNDFYNAHEVLATNLLKKNRLDEAEQSIKIIQKTRPKSAETSRLLADLALQRKLIIKAITHYQEAIKVNPNSNLVLSLSRAYFLSNEKEQSQLILEKWLKAHPKDHLIRLAIAEKLLHQNKTNQAINHFEILVNTNPDHPMLLNNLASLYLLSNDSRALKVAKKAYKISPKDPNISDTLGWILVKSNKPKLGLRYLRESQSRTKNNPELQYHLAVALSNLDRKKEAREILNNVLNKQLHFSSLEDAKELMETLK